MTCRLRWYGQNRNQMQNSNMADVSNGRIQWHVIAQPAAILQGAATGEFNVMIPELRVTLEAAANGRIQWHVISEPRITLQGAATWWIYYYDSRATCHVAGCCHLAKSMSWTCYIAGCKNSIHHIENIFFAIFYFILFLMQFGLWGAAAIVSSPIHLFCITTILNWFRRNYDEQIKCLPFGRNWYKSKGAGYTLISYISTAVLTYDINVLMLSICPSVRLSRSCILSKRLNISSHFLQHMVAQSL